LATAYGRHAPRDDRTVCSGKLNLAGDNERFFPLLLTLFVVGVCGAITAWAAIDLPRLPV
jgi:hypothetical protein